MIRLFYELATWSNIDPAVLQEVLWQKLSLAAEQMHKSVVAVWHVQRVLAKKRDPLSHVLFINECLEENAALPTEKFWYVACPCIMQLPY